VANRTRLRYKVLTVARILVAEDETKVAQALADGLTPIRSVGDVGLREHRTEEEYREIVGSVLEEAERLTTMTDSLLVLSRADSGKAELEPARLSLASLAAGCRGRIAVAGAGGRPGRPTAVPGSFGVLVFEMAK
jgi:signal transduction histidine kinase